MKSILLLAAGLTLTTGCYKDELDLDALRDNPFDADYSGPAVFILDTTFVETVTDEGPPFQRQVLRFHVRNDLFLSPHTTYRVRVEDQENGEVRELVQTAPGSHIIEFHKYDPLGPGQELCLDVAFIDNFVEARHETVCGTLQ